MGQPTLIKQMDEWRILPRTEQVTELYFTDYGRLAGSSRSGVAQTVAFAVHNIEHRTTTYYYTLTAMSEDGMVKHQIGSGRVTLAHNHSQVVDKTVVIPQFDGRNERIVVNVSLDYKSVVLGSNTASSQQQSIHFWANANTLSEDKKRI